MTVVRPRWGFISSTRVAYWCLGVVAVPGCGETLRGMDGGTGAGDGHATAVDTRGATSTGAGSGATNAEGTAATEDPSAEASGNADGATEGLRFDLAADTEGGTDGPSAGPSCKVVGGGDAVPECDETAPPGSFELRTEWGWDGDGENNSSQGTPLVANFTDDNGDGEVDLCDIPDVLLPACRPRAMTGDLYLLSGDGTGVHWKTPVPSNCNTVAAIGDVDGDGAVEVVYVGADQHLNMVNADGSGGWRSDLPWDALAQPVESYEASWGALALADLDADGDVEIVAGSMVFDHTGRRLMNLNDGAPFFLNATTAADLDEDGDLEIIVGRSAYHHDGSQYYKHDDVEPAMPQVADLDGDGRAEVLLQSMRGFSILEHDGTIKVQERAPLMAPQTPNAWHRPSAVHDFDGDGDPEFAVSVGGQYGVWDPNTLTSRWLAPVVDNTGSATGTAFDFLGDGGAEAIYGDETNFHIFDDGGGVLLQAPRHSLTAMEYPTVVDVDNDGSSEILVTSAEKNDGSRPAPTLRVYGDAQDRWVQSRRIWNQHTYHVTNVLEDGRIPQQERHHWKLLNTFRTNAQVSSAGACRPVPAG